MKEKLRLNTIVAAMQPSVRFFLSLAFIPVVFAFVYPLFVLAGHLAGYDLFAFRTVSADSGVDVDSLRYFQVVQHISMFILPPMVWSYIAFGSVFSIAGLRVRPQSSMVILVAFISLMLIPVNVYMGYLNSAISLGSFGDAGQWLSEREQISSWLTDMLLQSDSLSTLLVNIVIIALIPAFGEELFFRGLLQRGLNTIITSPHIVIVICALLFSSLHFQFYGFLPRFTLGMVYGYLFLWSGSVWLPATAHFVNNSVPVLYAFFYGWDSSNQQMTNTSLAESHLPFVAVTGVVLGLFYVRYVLKAGNRKISIF